MTGSSGPTKRGVALIVEGKDCDTLILEKRIAIELHSPDILAAGYYDQGVGSGISSGCSYGFIES
jgi:hypothetical protein